MKKHKNYLIVPIVNAISRTKQGHSPYKVFEKNAVSANHQFIILKISHIDMYNNTRAYELITREKFVFNDSIAKIILSHQVDREIKGISENIIVSIHPKLINIDEVSAFYKDIIETGEAQLYQKSVKEILLNNQKKLSLKRKV